MAHKRMNVRARRQERRQQAEERVAQWASLSLEAQLKELDSRPGNSTRQRARIQAKIDKKNPKNKEDKTESKS